MRHGRAAHRRWRRDRAGRAGNRGPDVCHRDRPAPTFRGENGVSAGFIGHSGATRARVPDGLGDGKAGENTLVETDRTRSEARLAGGLEIASATGPVVLSAVVAADPGAGFARHLLG